MFLPYVCQILTSKITFSPKNLIHKPTVDYEFFMGNNDETEEDGPQIVELVEESEVKTEAQNE